MENLLSLLLKRLIVKGIWRYCKEIFQLHGWMQDWCWYERTIVLVVCCYIICVVQLNHVLLVMKKIAEPRRILHLMMAELYPLIKGMRSCIFQRCFPSSGDLWQWLYWSRFLYFLRCIFSKICLCDVL